MNDKQELQQKSESHTGTLCAHLKYLPGDTLVRMTTSALEVGEVSFYWNGTITYCPYSKEIILTINPMDE